MSRPHLSTTSSVGDFLERRPSASDSLQGTLKRDMDRSLSETQPEKHGTWRDSMSGLARSMLLRAKGSIDHIRGVPELEEHQAERSLPARSYSFARGSLRSPHSPSHVPEVHRSASLSLRRVLTSSSRRSKRSSLLVNMMAKRSLTKLQGPEELLDDASDSGSTHTSAARASLRSLCLQESPRSNQSSPRSSEKVHTPGRHSRDHIPSTRGSSPIPIPRSSPPPTIDFDIESGKLSPACMFGSDIDTSSPEQTKPALPEIDMSTRDQMVITRRKSRRRAVKNEIDRIKEEHIHVPRRASNDHWRMRRVSRQRHVKLPEPITETQVPDMPSPMPGTNLPLEDPFERHHTPTESTSDAAVMESSTARSMDGAADGSRRMFSASSHSHHQDSEALEVSADFGRSEGLTASEPTTRDQQPVITDAPKTSSVVADDSRHAAAIFDASHQDDDRYVQLSPEALRTQIVAGRKALERLEGRMAGIEASLRKVDAAPDLVYAAKTADPGKPFASIAARMDLPASDASSEDTAPQHAWMSSPSLRSISLATSDTFSQSCQSPLETQDLFYPSEEESAMSSAQIHLQQMRHVACNGISEREADSSFEQDPSSQRRGLGSGTVSTREIDADAVSPGTGRTPRSSPCVHTTSFSTPDMGSSADFYRQRAERDARYWDIFDVKNRQHLVASEALDTRTDEMVESKSMGSRASSGWMLREDAKLERPAESPPPYSASREHSVVGADLPSDARMCVSSAYHGSHLGIPMQGIDSSPDAVSPSRNLKEGSSDWCLQDIDNRKLVPPPSTTSGENDEHATPLAQRNLTVDVMNLLRGSPSQESPLRPTHPVSSELGDPGIPRIALPFRPTQSSVTGRKSQATAPKYDKVATTELSGTRSYDVFRDDDSDKENRVEVGV
ncbi:hypothetical protein CAC42_2694 [Sphaceloma murrayae]|uniref:Uncharacterized protein n=1 Tax=Sphaceloma murrayae TaxID=2082308 RepID=A0A2K1R0R4_9PEZI|nr:hypothetical protein CAC42_2694 [Sphaceloma murrayae]